MTKYANYLIFGAIVLIVVGLAVKHARYIRTHVDDMGSPIAAVRSKAAFDLIQTEQFSDSVTGETIPTRRHAVDALVSLANDKSVVKGSGKDDLDYRARAVKQCVAMLKDTEQRVRIYAATGLKHIDYSDAESLKELVNGIGDGDPNVRKGVKSVFCNDDGIALGEAVVDAIVDRMKADGGTRGPAGSILGSPRFAAAHMNRYSVPALIAQLTARDPKDEAKYKNDEGVRTGAADALGNIGDPAAVQTLIAVMQSDTPAVRRVAIGAIALIADPAGEAALISAIRNGSTDSEARLQAATGLGKIASPEAVTTLTEALGDIDLKMRSAAVAALARAGRPESLSPVVIGQSAPPEAAPAGTGRPELASPTNARVIKALAAALSNRNDNVRIGAALALDKIASTESNGPLLATLRNDHNDSDLRAAAAAALGFTGNQAAVEPLIQALSDSTGDVRDAARNALSAIGPDATDALLAVMERGGAGAYYASQAIASEGQTALPALERSVQLHRNPVALRWDAVALGDMGIADADKPLQALARNSDPDVAYVAKTQLDRLGQMQ